MNLFLTFGLLFFLINSSLAETDMISGKTLKLSPTMGIAVDAPEKAKMPPQKQIIDSSQNIPSSTAEEVKISIPDEEIIETPKIPEQPITTKPKPPAYTSKPVKKGKTGSVMIFNGN